MVLHRRPGEQPTLPLQTLRKDRPSVEPANSGGTWTLPRARSLNFPTSYLLARDLGYLKPEEWGEIEALRDHAGRLTWGLYRAIDRKSEAL